MEKQVPDDGTQDKKRIRTSRRLDWFIVFHSAEIIIQKDVIKWMEETLNCESLLRRRAKGQDDCFVG